MKAGNFIDYVKIHIQSGNGGKGSTHLRREAHVPKGGPDGGDGGKGGDIIIRGNKELWTLYEFNFKRHFRATHGENGSKQRSTGANGRDEILEVPLGTVVRETDSQEIIREITEDGEEFIVAPGGKGGLGNWHFRTSINQTPRYAQPGLPGVEKDITLELKVLADVGLVGFPNAGKSTLLSVVSAAKPKIADYEFTTLKPNLGIVKGRDHHTFVMADIPGIIEGASEGRGLGHRFLRHIERNSTLLFIIPSDSPDIRKEYHILLNELQLYNPELLDKDRILAISKGDLLDEELEAELRSQLREEMPNKEPIIFSSITQKGLQELKDRLWEIISKPITEE